MHGHGFLDDEAIGQHLADGLAGVGVGDFGDFVRVEPDFAFAAAGDAGGQALLRAEVDPVSIGQCRRMKREMDGWSWRGRSWRQRSIVGVRDTTGGARVSDKGGLILTS